MYFQIDQSFIDFKDFCSAIDTLFIEIDNRGFVVREIGLNKNLRVVHRFPDSDFEYGEYGLFDLAQLELKTDQHNDLTESRFEELWNIKS